MVAPYFLAGGIFSASKNFPESREEKKFTGG